MGKEKTIIDNYFELASRTNKELPLKNHVIHMALGLSSELMEFQEQVLNLETCINCRDAEKHIKEELGDIFWYAANLCSKVFINSLRDIINTAPDPNPKTLEYNIGQLVSEAKRIYIYGKAVDENTIANLAYSIVISLIKEINYLGDSFNFTLEDILQENIDKLIKRYPDGFSELAANKRLDKNE